MEAGKSKIKVPADSALRESSHPARRLADGHHLAVSSHGREREKEREKERESERERERGCSFYSYKATIPVG